MLKACIPTQDTDKLMWKKKKKENKPNIQLQKKATLK